jgi:lysine-specific demethylase 8
MDILEDILANSQALPEVSEINEATFKKNYLNRRRPVIMKGQANSWPAREKWNIDYFLKLENNKKVRLDIGNIFQGESDATKQTFAQFMEKLKDSQTNGAGPENYLALFDIFSVFPELENDTDFSILNNSTIKDFIYGWIGPKGTVTGLHTDSANNLLAQLQGKKLVLIASPKYTKHMYLSKKFDLAAQVSSVNINDYDEEKHPRFREIPFYSVIMEPGDVLFIPQGWWHYVKSLDFSISVNNFGYRRWDMFTAYLYEKFINRMHLAGLYRKHNCTCHHIVDGEWVSKF